MPTLTFKNCGRSAVQNLSKVLPSELSRAVGCPEDWFVFCAVESQNFYMGEPTVAPAVAEVVWFDRGDDVRDAVAEIITRALEAELGGGKELETAVVFFDCDNRYYENGARA